MGGDKIPTLFSLDYTLLYGRFWNSYVSIRHEIENQRLVVILYDYILNSHKRLRVKEITSNMIIVDGAINNNNNCVCQIKILPMIHYQTIL